MVTKPPFIIFGAGASYDYVDPSLRDGIPQPPLTNHLVSNGYLNRTLLANYTPEASTVFSILAPKVNNNGPLTLEQCVAQIENPAQIIAFRYYLRDFFKDISSHYRLINNFKILLDQIDRSPSKHACIATFNYDTLLEQAMAVKEKWMEMHQYTTSNIGVVKLHGSCNWSYIEHKDPRSSSTDFQYFKKRTDYVAEHIYTDLYLQERVNNGPLHLLPALAVPAGITKDFVCPQEHVNYMKESLQQAERVLIVGWKAGDPKLIELMEATLGGRPVSFFIVAGSPEGVKEVWGKVEHINGASLMGEAHSFSEFVRSEMCPTFFGTNY